MKLLRQLLFHLVYFTLMGLLATLCVWLMGNIWGMAVMFLFWIPSIWAIPALYKRITGKEPNLHWLAILCVVIAIAGVARYFPNLIPLVSGKSVKNCSASDIPKHPEAMSFSFRDATVQMKYAFQRKVVTRSGKNSSPSTHYYMAAPLTDSTWTIDDPVPAWVICGDQMTDCAEDDHWSSTNRSAIVPTGGESLADGETVKQAMAKFGLHAAQNARLFAWCGSIEEAIYWRIFGYFFSIFGVYVIWAFFYSIRRIFKKNWED